MASDCWRAWWSGKSSDGYASPLEVLFLGVFLSLQMLVFLGLLLWVWPSDATKTAAPPVSVLGNVLFNFDLDRRVLALAALSGAIGSSVHACTSFADYVGNSKLSRAWMWWIIMRAPIGALLGLLTFMLVKGGLLQIYSTSGTGLTDLNMFGVAGFSALAGMFSKQATDKLADVFSALFRSDADKARSDKLDGAAPVLESLDPIAVKTGTAPPPKVTLHGQRFTADCMVQVGSSSRKPTVVSAAELTVDLTADDIAHPGSLDIVVTNAKTGAKSAARNLTVNP